MSDKRMIGGIKFYTEDLKQCSKTKDGQYKVELKSGQIFIFDQQKKTDIKMVPTIESGTSGFEHFTDIKNCHGISVFGSNKSDRFRIFESDIKTLKLSGDNQNGSDFVSDLINSKIERIDIDGNDHVAPNIDAELLEDTSTYEKRSD